MKPLYLAIFLTPGLTFAEVPDAGQIQRQQEQISPRIENLPPPEIPEPDLLTPSDQEVSVLVKSIIITGGEELEDESVLQELVADAIGKHLGFSQLQQLTERISQHLKAKGWLLAKAYLPKQDVTEGKIQIGITLGHLEPDEQGQSIHIERDPDTRLQDSVIQDHLRYIISSDTLDGQELERALLLLNDLPGIQSRANLEKGSQPGSSRLGVNLKEDALLNGNFAIDDFGNRYTGPWRGNLNANLNDALGIGDQLSIGGTGAENLGQGRAAYSLPLGSSGLKANAHYSYLEYSIGREFTALDSRGTAQYSGGGLSYAFVRTRTFSLWGNVDYTHKALRDSTLHSLTGNKQLDNGSVGFNGQSLDRFFGGGLNQFAYNANVGNVDLSDVATDFNADSTTSKTQGGYDKHTFSLARLQQLTENLSFFFVGNGQLAGKNLSSAEKFILGGPSGVRAYSVGEGNGDSGWTASFELRYDIPYRTDLGKLQVVGFIDTGHITLHEQHWRGDVTTLSGHNEYSLSGGGIGINYSRSNRFAIRSSWAHTIGDNPGRSLSGRDSDSKTDENRLWLQAMVSF